MRAWLAGNDCAQLESTIVLPKPAGAEMSVRGCLRLSASKPLRRGREISVPGATGIENLVARSWLWMIIDIVTIAHSPRETGWKVGKNHFSSQSIYHFDAFSSSLLEICAQRSK